MHSIVSNKQNKVWIIDSMVVPLSRYLRHPAKKGGLLCSHPDPLSLVTVAQV